MCGVVGVFSSLFTQKEVNIFEFLLTIDVVRGMDSTGINIVKRNNQTKTDYTSNVVKRVSIPHFLLSSKEYQEAKRATYPQSLCGMFGHNRAATKGVVKGENAHPFTFGNITLSHNGTLKDHWDPTLGSAKDRFDVDSEALAYGVSEHGLDKVWETLTGAATVTMWDNVAETFTFITNGERPFFWMTSADGRDMVYASESWMLKAVKERFKFVPDEHDIQFPKKNNVFINEFSNDGKIIRWGYELENKPVPAPVVSSTYKFKYDDYNMDFHYPGAIRRSWNGAHNSSHIIGDRVVQPKNQVSEVVKLIEFKEKNKDKAEQRLITAGDYGVPLNKVVGEAEYNDHYDKECCVCATPLHYDDDRVMDSFVKIGVCNDCFTDIEETKNISIQG